MKIVYLHLCISGYPVNSLKKSDSLASRGSLASSIVWQYVYHMCVARKSKYLFVNRIFTHMIYDDFTYDDFDEIITIQSPL